MKSLPDFDSIEFTEDDANLFQVDDFQLRADAIRYSVLPRLHQVFNHAVELIQKIYDVDVFEDSHVSLQPNHRGAKDRKAPVAYGFDQALVGLHGNRQAGKWRALKKPDGKEVFIPPMRLGIALDRTGTRVTLQNCGMYYQEGAFTGLFRFNIENEAILSSLCSDRFVYPVSYFGERCEPLASWKDRWQFCIDVNIDYMPWFFLSHCFPYPLNTKREVYSLNGLVSTYAALFPIYDSYVRICMGLPDRFTDLIARLNAFLRKEWAEDEQDAEAEGASIGSALSHADHARIAEAAETRIRVMPAMRWQVFQRDQWKCVACGRTANDDIILHVDHIVPRSKGGADELSNYQTLCHVCNIGKSNKDDTNIRELHAEA